MGLLRDKVEEALKKRKKKKWEILKECCKDDIEKMIEDGVSLREMIAIIKEAGVVNKLNLKEFHLMLTKHFGYKGRARKVRVFEVAEEEDQAKKAVERNPTKRKKENENTRSTVAEKLSNDFDIAKVAGYDFDNI